MKDGIIVGGGKGGGAGAYKAKIRVKAWVSFFVAIGLAGLAMEFRDDAGGWGFVPAGVSLLVTVVLWKVERPKDASFSCDDGDDPTKLYKGK